MVRRFVFGTLSVVVLAYAASFAFPPMPPVHGDGTYTYYWARSLAFDGDLDLGNDYALCGDPWGQREPVRPGLGPRNTWSPGPSLLWVPFLWAGRLVHPAADHPNPRVAQACPGSPLAKLAMVGTVLAGLLTVWLSYRLARRHAGPSAAALGAAAVGLASPLPYYATLLPSYAHAPAALAVALALERWDATRGDPRILRWAGIGGLVGLAMLMRAQCAVIALAPLIEWLADLRRVPGGLRGRLRRVLAGVAFVLSALVAFFPQMLAWRITYGAWLAVPQGSHYMRWGEPALDGVLFASTGGLFVWSPVLLLAVVGLVLAVASRRARPIGLPFLLIFLAFVYVNAAVWDWWGASSFGNRRFTALASVFSVGLAVLLARLLQSADAHPRRFARGALALGLAGFAIWSFAGMWVIAKAAIPAHVEGRTDRFASRIFEELAGGVWTAVGNPLAWPASLPFALRYGTHPRRYDLLRGEGLFYRDFNDLALRPGEDRALLTQEPGSHYAARGFADRPLPADRSGGRPVLPMTASRATLLLPLFAGDVASVTFRWRRVEGADAPTGEETADIAVHWNGRSLGMVAAPRRLGATEIPLPEGVAGTGINEVELRVPGPARRVALASVILARRGPATSAPPPGDGVRDVSSSPRSPRPPSAASPAPPRTP